MDKEALDLGVLPDFSSIRAQASWNYTLQNYIESKGTFELAIAFARLFWPAFVERNGCILRADVLDEEAFNKWWQEKSGDTKAIERVLNLIHVEELVPSDSAPLDRSAYVYLARTLVQTWSACVKAAYPDREFVVVCEGCEDPEADVGPTVYLYQAR